MIEKIKEFLLAEGLPIPDKFLFKYDDGFSVFYNINEKDCACNFKLNISELYFENKDEDKALFSFFETLGLKINISNIPYAGWICGLLHELGHIATLPHFSSQDRFENRFLVGCLELDYIEEKYIDTCFAYWSTPLEKAANEWVVNLLNAEPTIVEKISNIIKEGD